MNKLDMIKLQLAGIMATMGVNPLRNIEYSSGNTEDGTFRKGRSQEESKGLIELAKLKREIKSLKRDIVKEKDTLTKEALKNKLTKLNTKYKEIK